MSSSESRRIWLVSRGSLDSGWRPDVGVVVAGDDVTLSEGAAHVHAGVGFQQHPAAPRDPDIGVTRADLGYRMDPPHGRGITIHTLIAQVRARGLHLHGRVLQRLPHL